MEISNYISKLLKIFDSMTVDQIAYLDYNPKSSVNRYIQDSNITKFSNIYFNFKKSGFLKWSTIRENRVSLSKLLTYQNELIGMTYLDNALEFRVYNKVGELIDRRIIRFIDNVNRLTYYFLIKRHPNLVLSSK
jgi:hypothetical protein